MIDPDVRAAAADDVEQLRWLESVARTTLIDQRGGPRWLETHPERAGAWATTIGAANVFVAMIDDVLVGYIVMSVATRVATIDDVFVLSEARELGFGDAMLAAALDSARSQGAELLEGEALPGDRDTKNLYERAAIKARLITVSAAL